MTRVLYLTLNVLGDPGANAAELFPKLAVAHPQVEHVVVADRAANLDYIRNRQGAECLILYPQPMGLVRLVRTAGRIARRAKADRMDLIHAFYRQENIALILLIRLWLLVFLCPARLLVDHRSVNLAKGRRSWLKKTQNLFMQMAVHGLAGNPNAVRSNHWLLWKRSHIVDLGYDRLPDNAQRTSALSETCVWYTGSLKPLNRKSGFLLDVFDRIATLSGPTSSLRIYVAGSAHPDQMTAMKANPRVHYLGCLDRSDLYQRMAKSPGVGIAYMNREFHDLAPSLKFCEYAALGFKIAASDTFGLVQQAERFGIHGVQFLPEDAQDWAAHLIDMAHSMTTLQPAWAAADQWSYAHIFEHQVVPLYQTYLRPQRQAELAPRQPVAEPREA